MSIAILSQHPPGPVSSTIPDTCQATSSPHKSRSLHGHAPTRESNSLPKEETRAAAPHCSWSKGISSYSDVVGHLSALLRTVRGTACLAIHLCHLSYLCSLKQRSWRNRRSSAWYHIAWISLILRKCILACTRWYWHTLPRQHVRAEVWLWPLLHGNSQ